MDTFSFNSLFKSFCKAFIGSPIFPSPVRRHIIIFTITDCKYTVKWSDTKIRYYPPFDKPPFVWRSNAHRYLIKQTSRYSRLVGDSGWYSTVESSIRRFNYQSINTHRYLRLTLMIHLRSLEFSFLSNPFWKRKRHPISPDKKLSLEVEFHAINRLS